MGEGFEDEELYDEVSGRKRRSYASLLNKQKLSKLEMDEIFMDE